MESLLSTPAISPTAPADAADGERKAVSLGQPAEQKTLGSEQVKANALARDLDTRVEGTAESVRTLQGINVANQFRAQAAEAVQLFRIEAEKVGTLPESDANALMERLVLTRMDIIFAMDSARGTPPETWIWPDPSKPRMPSNAKVLLDIRSAVLEIRQEIAQMSTAIRQMAELVTGVKQLASELIARQMGAKK